MSKLAWMFSTIIVVKEFKEQRKKVVTFVIMAFILLVWVFNTIIITKSIQNIEVEKLLSHISNLLFTHQAFSFFFIICFMFSVSLFYKEKVSKTLESLLVTPLTPKMIWFGKSFFIFLIGVSFSYFGVFFCFITLNYFLNPSGSIVYPDAPSLFFFFAIFPPLSLILACLIGLINLLSSGSTISNVIFLLIGIGYMAITSAKADRMTMNWAIIFIYFAFLCILTVIVVIGSRFLTKERIIMSGK
nr:hypothetical protein [Nanoarchaeum sp.]